MVEKPIIVVHCPTVQYSIKGRFHLVFQCKAVPANLAMGVFQDTSVEPAQDVGIVILGIGATDG